MELAYYPKHQGSVRSFRSATTVWNAETNGNDSKRSPYQSSIKPITLDNSTANTFSEAYVHALYDMLEAAMFSISDGQIFLSLAFSVSFASSTTCKLSQYHLQIGINMWLTATTNAVLSLAIVRNYFRSFFSGLLRLIALLSALVFSLGLPLLFRLNSGFASETLPPNDRNNSQVLLKAACFMDSSFRKVVVDDQINNTIIIGASTTDPMMSQEFMSWAAICCIWAIIVIGRVILGIRSVTQEQGKFSDHNIASKTLLAFWGFVLVVWIFAVGSFGYRVCCSIPWIRMWR